MDNKAIIERGYTLKEEYEAIAADKLEKLNLKSGGDFSEGIWIYPLESSDHAGVRFHFVFCNNPVAGIGAPRPICGLVGVGTGRGRDERGVADFEECIVLFEKAGKAAIDYFYGINS